MITSIFYKEWIKTRRILLLSLVVFAALITYIFINVEQMFRINGATQVWTETILKDISVLTRIQWLPLILSVLFGVSQFVPEMSNKRLKLTLHLPMPENKIMFSMLAFGLSGLLILYAITYMAILGGLNIYYPPEIVWSMVEASLPWFLAGLAGYLFVAWICIEPVWRHRVFNTLIAAYALTFFMISAKSGAYMPFIPYLLAIIIVAHFFSFYSMYRFKDGSQ
ncbi:MAG: hypothetical protein LBS04_06280 [Tannerellaceae bacterium]|jgi:ABC-type transport system involved in multi-copper enzyme maturation permease subunit|nr:hypothetical protein [Tannerellaceae bacterium]